MKFKTMINNALIFTIGAVFIALLFTLVAYAFSTGFFALLLAAAAACLGYLLIRRNNETSTNDSKRR